MAQLRPKSHHWQSLKLSLTLMTSSLSRLTRDKNQGVCFWQRKTLSRILSKGVLQGEYLYSQIKSKIEKVKNKVAKAGGHGDGKTHKFRIKEYCLSVLQS